MFKNTIALIETIKIIDEMIITTLIILNVYIIYLIYSLWRSNLHNGLFDMTAFEMFVREELGITDEAQVEEYLDLWAKYHNKLFHEIDKMHITEDGFRDAIVKFKKQNHYNV